ncbi:MAG TPA: GMC family oxidoreductase N-terminal domain-containing protein [Gallionellaceae bacterium]|nr:GMC family oxidoreductase N-terminal domain-containing protein [Gallionellaceae bacterium]
MTKSIGTYDYIIIGGGTAGCVLANRLSADPDIKVLMLEAGGKDNYMWIHIPVGYLYCIGNPRTDWCFKTEPVPGLNGRAIGYPRGRVLGGSSSINGMIYMRGQVRDFEQWKAQGNPGWGWDDVLPYYKRHEDYQRGADEMHNAGGEWRIEKQRLSWEILDAFRDAAAEVGIPKVIDFNRGNNEGCGYFEVNQKRGVRWNATKGFLRPVLKRPNLKVLTHAVVKRLRFDGKRVIGVEFWQGNQLFQADATVETLLAAGAVSSPQLLQCSGIGPAALLQQHGIPLVHELPGVGENLQDHLQLRMAFKVSNTRTLNETAGTLLGKLGMGLQYMLLQSGPLSMSPSQLGAFARSDACRAMPNLEYHVQPLSLDKFGEPLHSFPAFTASVCNLNPESRGYIRINSADSRVAPLIQPNYLATEGDRKVAADSLRLTRRIVAASALKRYEPAEFKPGPAVQSDEELAQAAGNIGTTIFHPAGTCKMGNNHKADPMAVVDARLRVHGIAGLRVVDASIMPTITSGNTCSPVVMFAEKASVMIREDRKRG